MTDKLVEIARFSTSVEARIAQNYLEEQGIKSRLHGEAFAGWFWHYGGDIAGIRLIVKSTDADHAKQILSSDWNFAIEELETGDESPREINEKEINELQNLSVRTLNASIIGIFLLPPLLNIYSMYLIIRHRLFRLPGWKIKIAICINLTIFLGMLLLISSLFMTEDRLSPKISKGSPSNPIEHGANSLPSSPTLHANNV